MPYTDQLVERLDELADRYANACSVSEAAVYIDAQVELLVELDDQGVDILDLAAALHEAVKIAGEQIAAKVRSEAL